MRCTHWRILPHHIQTLIDIDQIIDLMRDVLIVHIDTRRVERDGILPVFELNPNLPDLNMSGQLRTMVYCKRANIKVVKVDVLRGGDFTLTLLRYKDPYGPESLIKEISQPENSDSFDINQTI